MIRMQMKPQVLAEHQLGCPAWLHSSGRLEMLICCPCHPSEHPKKLSRLSRAHPVPGSSQEQTDRQTARQDGAGFSSAANSTIPALSPELLQGSAPSWGSALGSNHLQLWDGHKSSPSTAGRGLT